MKLVKNKHLDMLDKNNYIPRQQEGSPISKIMAVTPL